MFARHVHSGLQHECRERDARNPGDETDDSEDTEEEEHYSASILLASDVVDSCREGKNDVQDTCSPDECLGEVARAHEIQPGENEGDDQDENE